MSPEPVNHGKVLRFLATLRFPLWVALVTWLVIRDFGLQEAQAIPHRAIHALLEAPLVIAFSTWLLIMVPVGLPLLYFTVGMLAHIGIGLTGGAPRSLGATMRALGYALAPALLAIAILDWPLHLGRMPGAVYLPVLGFVAVVFWGLAAISLGRTHRISLLRAALVVTLPVLVFVSAHAGRAALQLATIPGVEPPPAPYYIP